MTTADGVQDNVEKIALLFPDCVTETRDNNTGRLVHKVDFDKLRQELSDSIVSDREERYQFTWPDKSKAILLANAPVNAALRPCRKESVDFDNTKNLYIEGDNLDVLKCLKETYLHQVKMIYIDPPYDSKADYRTKVVLPGADVESRPTVMEQFAYADTWSGELHIGGQREPIKGTLAYLRYMYPRLVLMRELLSDQGSFYFHIDWHMNSYARVILDDIFGKENFLNDIVWSYGAGGSPRGFYPYIVLQKVFQHILY